MSSTTASWKKVSGGSLATQSLAMMRRKSRSTALVTAPSSSRTSNRGSWIGRRSNSARQIHLLEDRIADPRHVPALPLGDAGGVGGGSNGWSGLPTVSSPVALAEAEASAEVGRAR